jgi:hypothetical protein
MAIYKEFAKFDRDEHSPPAPTTITRSRRTIQVHST